MAEYISRKAAIAYIREQSEECQKAFEELGGESGIYADAYNDLAEDFYSIPTADVAPVRHAEWVVCGDGDNVPWMCSHCGKTTAHKYKVIYGKYCPHCGAKMDGEKKDGGDNDALN